MLTLKGRRVGPRYGNTAILAIPALAFGFTLPSFQIRAVQDLAVLIKTSQVLRQLSELHTVALEHPVQ